MHLTAQSNQLQQRATASNPHADAGHDSNFEHEHKELFVIKMFPNDILKHPIYNCLYIVKTYRVSFIMKSYL
jgi:hypothetical protein